MIKKTFCIAFIASLVFCGCSSSQATTDKTDNKEKKEEPKQSTTIKKNSNGNYLR